ncbi:MAG: DUF2156 domain-containing protein [Desulfomonilaceae bacterium]
MTDFKQIELTDKKVFDDSFAEDPPRTSELTFTNLFMWRYRYQPVWSTWDDCLLIILRPAGEEPFGLPPTGPENKEEALARLLQKLKEVSSEPRISRVGKDFVENYVDADRYEIIHDRDNSDYVYLSEDLIKLSGNKFHRKKNHVNKFKKNHDFEYRSLDDDLAKSFLELQETWCELKDCSENPALLHEDYAIYEALCNYKELGFRGGAISINSKVEAFALGELLNPDTAVIHIEKANPDIPGLYAAINQLFCAKEWSGVKYINREQDLGLDNLRKAKESYYPDHMVEKYTVIHK